MNRGTDRSADPLESWIGTLPAERAAIVRSIRSTVNESLPPGFVESFDKGMINWEVPLSRLAETYNGRPLMYAGLTCTKNHVSLYLMGPYGDERSASEFRNAVAVEGKRLDMSKACVRFRSEEDLPHAAIAASIAGTTVEEFVAAYEAVMARRAGGHRR